MALRDGICTTAACAKCSLHMNSARENGTVLTSGDWRPSCAIRVRLAGCKIITSSSSLNTCSGPKVTSPDARSRCRTRNSHRTPILHRPIAYLTDSGARAPVILRPKKHSALPVCYENKHPLGSGSSFRTTTTPYYSDESQIPGMHKH